MMSDFPERWVEVPIGTVARIVGGGTPPSKDPANFTAPGQGIPWLTPADLSNYRKQIIERGARDLTDVGFAACGATLMPKGTVLFSSRAPIGYVAIAASEISTNQGFKSFILPPGIDSRFTYYQLKWLKPEAEAIATGTTFKELSGATIATLPFKVAPAAEQTRIANQLDTLLTRIQACNDRFAAIPALLKRFRQTVLDAALNGTLLESEEVSVKKVPKVQISAIAAVGTGSTPLRSNGQFFASTGTPWVTSSATSNAVITGASEFVTPAGVSTNRLKIYPKGTLLVAMYGEGKTRGQVAQLGIEATINQACAAVVVDGTKALPAYVKLALQANYLSMRELAEGGSQPNLNLSKVKEFVIPLPSLVAQTEIVRRVEALFALSDRMERRCKAARVHAERLTSLALSKAFRGELVPQDPNEEPASALMARMAAALALAPASAKGTSPRKPRTRRTNIVLKETGSMTKSRHDEDVKGKPYLTGHLRRAGKKMVAQELFKMVDLPIADFYKQLAWEVNAGLIKDRKTTLESSDAT